MSITSDYDKLVVRLDPADSKTISFIEGRQAFQLGPYLEGRFSQDVAEAVDAKYHNNPSVTLRFSIPGFRFEAYRAVSEAPLRVPSEGPWNDVVDSYLLLVRKALIRSRDGIDSVGCYMLETARDIGQFSGGGR